MSKPVHRSERAAESRFPFKVDIPVPEDGLRTRLIEMMAWCRANAVTDEWDCHTHTERMPDRAPTISIRFYFATDSDVEAFRRQWLT